MEIVVKKDNILMDKNVYQLINVNYLMKISNVYNVLKIIIWIIKNVFQKVHIILNKINKFNYWIYKNVNLVIMKENVLNVLNQDWILLKDIVVQKIIYIIQYKKLV